MAMEVEWDNEIYFFEMEEVTTEQWMKIKQVHNLNIIQLGQGMQQGDISALISLLWLMKIQNGLDRLRLETVTIASPVKFLAAVMQGLIKEQEALIEKAKKLVEEDEAKAPKE